jgi:hypothetical protein
VLAAAAGSGEGSAAQAVASQLGRARAELVAAVGLARADVPGAAAELREATRGQLGRLAGASDRHRTRQSRSQTRVDLILGTALAGICAVILADRPG